jgi:hypothetical protein
VNNTPHLPQQSSSDDLTDSRSAKRFVVNRDCRRRDSVLQIDVDWEDEDQHGGIVDFDCIDIEQLAKLLDERFINPDERQNQSPSVVQFFHFMTMHSAARAFGYAVSPLREDYGLVIEGLLVAPDDNTPEIAAAFEEFCSQADILEVGVTLRSWWD